MSNHTPDKPTDATGAAKTRATLLTGCLAAAVGIPLLLFLISAVIGLITGNLYYFGRRGETYHGATARIISGVILIIAAFIVLIILKSGKKARAQNR